MASYEIRLTNLNWSAQEDDIKAFVSTFAKVKEVKLVRDFRQRSKGLAYLKLEDEQSLKEALLDVERVHMDRKIKIVKAIPLSEKPPREQRPRTEKTQVEKKEQAPRQNQKTDRKQSGENADKPQSFRGGRGRGGRGRGGRGTPKVSEGEARDTNQSRERGTSRGRGGRGGRGGFTKRTGEQKERTNDEHSVYVGNLSWNTTEMNLGRNFESYGDIKNVKIIEDAEGRSKGFGYVEFDKKESAQNALTADGSELDGRNLKVKPVKQRENKPRN